MSETSSAEEGKGAGTGAPAAATPAHCEDILGFLERIEINSADGLPEEEAQKRLARHGKNLLPEAKKKSDLLRILEQFKNPLVLTLLAAATIAVVVGFTSGAEVGLLAR